MSWLLALPTEAGGWVFFGVGATLVVLALVMGVRRRALVASWERTEGVVIGHRVRSSRRDGRVRTYHHPQVRFEARGEGHVLDSPIGHGQVKWEVGTRLPVRFDAKRLDDACIDTFGQHYFVSLVIGAIGAVFVVVSLVLP
jgi:hypothetical protein